MPDRPPLTRDLIVRAATHLLDEAGAAEFSMRRLAAALGVDPMAVYRHLPGKAAILHEVLEAAVAQLPLPDPGSPWQERVRALCVAYRDLAHRHPGVFRQLYPYPRPIRAELVAREACFAALRDGGLAPADAARGWPLVLNYAAGFALDELAGWERLPDPESDPHASLLAEGDFPETRRLAPEMGRPDPEADFAFGLDVLLRGLAARAGEGESFASRARGNHVPGSRTEGQAEG